MSVALYEVLKRGRLGKVEEKWRDKRKCGANTKINKQRVNKQNSQFWQNFLNINKKIKFPLDVSFLFREELLQVKLLNFVPQDWNIILLTYIFSRFAPVAGFLIFVYLLFKQKSDGYKYYLWVFVFSFGRGFFSTLPFFSPFFF